MLLTFKQTASFFVSRSGPLFEEERNETMDFSGKTCIVTGAASGIGKGIAEKLLQHNANVVLVDIDEKRLQEIKSAHTTNGKIEIRLLDVTKYEDVLKCFNEIRATYGKIDYLFNNAGIGGTLPFEQATMAQWQKIVNLNLFGVINGVTAVYPIMVEQKSGHIVNTSSIAGIMPFPGQVLYNTTKYGVTGLSLSLMKEAKKNNIDISIICPGMVKTRIFYKPIIGQEASEKDVKIPQEAISVETAVKDIFEGLEKKKTIIITPKSLTKYYRSYRLFGRLP
jgi:short-subunit dehydrogenase